MYPIGLLEERLLLHYWGTVGYCGVLWGTVGYCTVGYCGVLWGTVGYCTVGYCGVLWGTVGYCGVLWGTVLWGTVGYCGVLWGLWGTALNTTQTFTTYNKHGASHTIKGSQVGTNEIIAHTMPKSLC